MAIMSEAGSILTRPSGGILATDCGDAGPSQNPYCSNCTGTDPRASYVVTLSGFPFVCGVQYFNGVWTVTQVSDCEWACQLDPTRRLRLSILSGWSVTWQDTAPGGPSGDFLATSGTSCRPETGAWIPNACFEPFGCWGLRTQYLANAACTVGLT